MRELGISQILSLTEDDWIDRGMATGRVGIGDQLPRERQVKCAFQVAGAALGQGEPVDGVGVAGLVAHHGGLLPQLLQGRYPTAFNTLERYWLQMSPFW
jgi:hypothetical protein